MYFPGGDSEINPSRPAESIKKAIDEQNKKAYDANLEIQRKCQELTAEKTYLRKKYFFT